MLISKVTSIHARLTFDISLCTVTFRERLEFCVLSRSTCTLNSDVERCKRFAGGCGSDVDVQMKNDFILTTYFDEHSR